MSPEPSTPIPAASLDELSVNALRFLAVDAVQKANSGHPGLPLGSRGDVLAVDRFGASAPDEVVMREYGFTADNVCARALALLR